MDHRKNKLFEINRKYIIIGAAVLAVIALIAAISMITASGRLNAEKNAAVGQIAELGVINVGLRGDIYPLSEYDEQTKEFSGFEKDVADEIMRRIFGDDIIMNYVVVNSETKDALLLSGTLDVSLAASVKGTISEIKYSVPFYTDRSAYLVRQDEMTTEAELAGRTIAVVQSSPEAAASADNKKISMLEAYLNSRGITATIKAYASYPEAVDALRSKFVDAVCASETFLKIYGRSGMIILGEQFLPVGLCVQIRSNLGEFYLAVDDAIADMKADETLNALIEKWGLTDYAYLNETK